MMYLLRKMILSLINILRVIKVIGKMCRMNQDRSIVLMAYGIWSIKTILIRQKVHKRAVSQLKRCNQAHKH